jgi:hypothetical protein
LQEAGAIRECEEHGWMQDRIDPHARERAFAIARQDPRGVSPQAAAVAIAEVLQSIGDTCPGRSRDGLYSRRIVRDVSRPLASAASTVPMSRPR